MFNHNFTKLTNFLAASFLGAIFFPSLVFNICLLLGIGEPRWVIAGLAGLVAPIVFYYQYAWSAATSSQVGAQPAWRMNAIIILLGFLSIATTISYYIYDLSYDGTSYHADAILSLMQGVNPIYQKLHGFDDLWTNHYPKAIWYFCAVVAHITGNYNIGKIYNYLLIYAVTAYIFSCLKQKGITSINSGVIALATALSPVAVAQLNSFYADGAVCSLTTLAIFSGVACIFTKRKIDYIIFVMSSCLLINVKFTGAASVGIILIILAIWQIRHCEIFYRKSWQSLSLSKPELATPSTKARNDGLWQLIISAAAICLIGGLVMGFNPYVSNYIEEGHPFFPLFGKHKVEIIKGKNAQNPYSYNTENTTRVGQILASVFSETRNMYKGHTAEPILKIPFTLNYDQIDDLSYTDTRIAGWGVFLGGILLISFALYLLSKGWKDKQVSLLLIITLITILINPGAWWARYAPQVALIPILFILPVFASSQSKRGNLFAFWQYIVIFLYLANSLIIAIPSSWLVIDETDKLNAQIEYILQKCGKGTYIVKGHDGWHYEQLLNSKGIEITFPKQPINPPKNQLFPLYDLFLYKDGCKR